jgi:hypothetical protein
MKNMLRTVVLVSLFVPLAAGAQPLWSVTLYENGNGTANGNSLNGVLMADPSGGLAGNVLVYTLPFNFPAGSVGDYLLLEPPNYSSVSDVIRFWGNNQVIFYSDLDNDPGDPYQLADTGLPGSYLTPPTYIPPAQLQEVNLGDGIWGAIHSAISGEPGYIGAGFGNYTFISDVPEPNTLAIIGVSLTGLAFMAYRRRSK